MSIPTASRHAPVIHSCHRAPARSSMLSRVSVSSSSFCSVSVSLSFAFSPSNPDLRDAVNVVLAQMIADGTYQEIFNKYFPPDSIPDEFKPTA